MSDVFETKAKKISADQVEVVDATGAHVAGKEAEGPAVFSGMKVVKVGPMGGVLALLALPLLLPLMLIALLFIAILAVFFGKAFFRTGFAKVMRR